MPSLEVSDDRTHLTLDGQPHLLCADTVWSAFSDIQPGEWTAYLHRRRQQGFNALLISVLPILHDRTEKPDSLEPFRIDGQGNYDYGSPSSDYFARARAMVAEAAELGMVAVLAVLWANYVEGTWAARRTPAAPMPDAERAAYLQLVAGTFADLCPVFAVSGDDNLADAGPVSVFLSAMNQLRSLAPNCLTTLHTTPNADLPPRLAQSEALDFYSYQSGHHADGQGKVTSLAEQLLAKPRRPIWNAEPCYEAHGRAGGEGRFSALDVRRATWLSFLSGASAGIGYGAHGVWQWHRPGGAFNNSAFSRQPLTWQAALELPGAWDVGHAIGLLGLHGFAGARPRQDLIVHGDRPARLAERDGQFVAYSPYTQALAFSLPRRPEAVQAYDLDRRTIIRMETNYSPGQLTIGQPDVVADFAVFVS